jgi:hypothetical protein
MSDVRVHNFAISLDGFATGAGQAPDAPFGHAGQRLHEWMFTTRFWHEMVGGRGGSVGADNAFAAMHGPGIGAEIMGAGKFGPPGWQNDPDYKGAWGANPPFHTPVFVLTHRPIVLGRGVRLWDGLESLEEAYNIEAVSTPSGVTHLTFTARR